MHIRVDGERFACAIDAEAIEAVLVRASATPQAFVAMHKSDEEFLQVALGTDQELVLLRASAAGQRVVVPEHHFSMPDVAALFAMYAVDDPQWRRALPWDQDDNERLAAHYMAKGRRLAKKLALGALALVWVLLTGAVVAGKLPWHAALKLFGAVLSFLAYLWWLFHFFSRLRPRVRDWLGRQLGVTLIEGLGHGKGWQVVRPTAWWQSWLAFCLDLPFTVLGVMLPFGVGLCLIIYVFNGGHF
jgi:hypothetical protein